MIFAIRLCERLDGTATAIEGMYVSVSCSAASTGSPVTADPEQALRFAQREEAAHYIHGLASGISRQQDRLKRLADAYLVEVVPLRPLRPRHPLAAG